MALNSDIAFKMGCGRYIQERNAIVNNLKVGVCGFGIGSNIVDKKLIEAENYEAITELARVYTSQL